jgi:LPXTG-motif cell wall-anchored protein
MPANLFPWFPLAGKAGDLIVILIGLAAVVAVAMLVAGKRQK